VSDTAVSLLTPKGVGAIATIEVAGPRAWELARQLFKPAGKPLPELHRFWFGTLGEGVGDEVILAVTGEDRVEIHCHGGRRVVRWIIDHFLALGCNEREPPRNGSVLDLLSRAPTLRTAGILLDQLHGAFENALRHILALLETEPRAAAAALDELARFAPIGRHLVSPWKVVIAGAPNVGKSSLVNALAGYQRAVVSEVAGTTRDAVSVQLAFDGWPVEVTDTAGLRDAEGLEAEGIERARRVQQEADLVVWLLDATKPSTVPGEFVVWNKTDLAIPPSGIGISAKTGQGIPQLVAEITRRVVPVVPAPGAAVPFTPRLADLVEAARDANDPAEATRLLRDCLAIG
jgi:tRNA modification GTPase